MKAKLKKALKQLSAALAAFFLSVSTLTGSGSVLLPVLAQSETMEETAETSPPVSGQDKFEQAGGKYSLGYILRHYQILSFGDLALNTHCMGSVLVDGRLSGNGSGFSDSLWSTRNSPSYIAGTVKGFSGEHASRVQKQDRNQSELPLYLGTENSNDIYPKYYSANDFAGYVINVGWEKVFTKMDAVFTDTFVDFARMKKVIQAESSWIASNSSDDYQIEAGNNRYVIQVPAGSSVKISKEDFDQLSSNGDAYINVISSQAGTVDTFITVDQEGNSPQTLKLPHLRIDNSQPNVSEESSAGNSIVVNMVNLSPSTTVEIPSYNWMAHVIAPDNPISMSSGNYNGCLIGNSMNISGEGHLYRYNGFVLPDEPAADLSSEKPEEPEEPGEEKPAESENPQIPEEPATPEEPELISIPVEKIWHNETDGPQSRPESIEVQLLQKGNIFDTMTLTEAENWQGTFENLPKTDENGNAFTYTIREKEIPNYISSVYRDSQGNVTITNTYRPSDAAKQPEEMGQIRKTVSIPVVKQWDDSKNVRTPIHPPVTVQLLKNGEIAEGKTLTLSEYNHWEDGFQSLDAEDEQGNPIEYSITELPVENYTATIEKQENGSYVITNSYLPDEANTTSIPVTKLWDDNANAARIRPISITLTLTSSDPGILPQSLSLFPDSEDSTKSWKGEFDYLPVLDEQGNPIEYTIEEKDIPGYGSKIEKKDDGSYVITNTWLAKNQERITIPVTKVWQDNGEDRRRPESITIHLISSDPNANTFTRTLTEEDGWTCKFLSLPTEDDYGNPIQYFVTEDPIEGYTTKIFNDGENGFKVVNAFIGTKLQKQEIETTSLPVRKIWDDEDDAAGKRPSSITVELTDSRSDTVHQQLTLSEDEGWQASFENLDLNDENGKAITYRIQEKEVEGYTASFERGEIDGKIGYIITNTYTVPDETPDEPVDQPQTQPEPEEKADQAQTQPEPEPQPERIEKQETIKQPEPQKNTATQPVKEQPKVPESSSIEIPVEKIWIGDEQNPESRPEKIKVNLFRDGNTKVAQTLTLSGDTDWKGSFKNLPAQDKDGNEIKYEIREESVPDYKSEITEKGGSYVITNTYRPEEPNTLSIPVTKVWKDNEDAAHYRPKSIIIQLLQNEQSTPMLSLELNESNQWHGSFTKLPVEDKLGNPYAYSIREVSVPHYRSKIELNEEQNGYVVTNTLISNTNEQVLISLPVHKIWEDSYNKDGSRPEKITIHLLADDEVVETRELSQKDGWSTVFTDLPEQKDGRTIRYTVTEDKVKDYISRIESNSKGGFTITNTLAAKETEEGIVQQVTIAGKKTWVGDDEEIRPESIHIILKADGTEIANQDVTEKDDWKWKFKDLPAYRKGSKVVYTIEESPVDGYVTEIDGYNVTNIYSPVLPEEENLENGPVSATYRTGLRASESQITRPDQEVIKRPYSSVVITPQEDIQTTERANASRVKTAGASTDAVTGAALYGTAGLLSIGAALFLYKKKKENE